MPRIPSLRRIPSAVWLYWILVVAFVLRWSLLDFESGDYRAFFGPWYDFIVEHGGIGALKHDFSPYALLYLYFLAAATWLPVPKLYAIKLISVLFDYLAAYFVFKIVSLKYGKAGVAYAAAGVALFLPTVVINGSLWGQCDVLYTTGFLAGLYWVMIRKPVPALIAFGFACSLKPQAIFIAPFLAGLLVRGIIPWRLVWIPPATYLLSGLPALLVGKPLALVVLNHLRIGGLNVLVSGMGLDAPRLLTMNAANWYQWVPDGHYGVFLCAGVILAITCSALLVLSTTKWPRRADEKELCLTSALLSVLILPFFLPIMHERYFFAADLLSVAYAFYFPRRIWVTLAIQCVSLFSYFPYLFRMEPISLAVLALVMALTIEVVVADYLKLVWFPKSLLKNPPGEGAGPTSPFKNGVIRVGCVPSRGALGLFQPAAKTKDP
jgi:Gpi18-like mannosyltransferase